MILHRSSSPRILFTLIIAVALFLAGCGSELPPEPGSPSVPVGKATGIYEGYSPPNDVYNNNVQIFFLSKNVFNLEPEQENIDLGLSVSHEQGYVYKYGYYYSNNGWKKFEFLDQTISGSNWIKEKASAYLSTNTKELTPGENYVVAYSCKRYDKKWRCGCSYQGGPCNQWMIQTYLYRNVELPPEPIPPGSLITTRVYISPNWQIFRSGQDIDLYVSMESTRENLNNQADSLSIRIQRPDYGQELTTLKKYGDVNCYECKEKDGNCYRYYRQFNCYVYFYGKYTPPLAGNYFLDFGVDKVKVPEWMKVENGEFKILSHEIFKEYLIEEDIGQFKFTYSGGSYSTDGQGFYATYYKDKYLKTSTYLGVNINDFKWSYRSFQDIKNDKNYQPQMVEGNEVWVRTDSIHTPYYEEVINNVHIVWNNYGRTISIYVSGSDVTGYKDVLLAYLKKFPSNNETKNSLYLIEKDIGEYKFVSSNYYDTGSIRKYYALYGKKGGSQDYENSNYASTNVYQSPDVLDLFKRTVRYGDFSQQTIGNNIIYTEINVVRSFITHIWMSKGMQVYLSISGPEINDSSVILDAYLAKHPSDNVIVEPEHYPGVLIEQDIREYKYKKSILQTEYGGKTNYYQASYTGINNSIFLGGVITSNDSKYIQYILNRVADRVNISKIEGQNVFVHKGGENYVIWTNSGKIIFSGGNYGDLEVPIEITKAYLAKYPSDLPENYTRTTVDIPEVYLLSSGVGGGGGASEAKPVQEEIKNTLLDVVILPS